ncbi:MAG: SDR family oxidoreductase [Clostridia bacterium]|nr:SDR family oxidoreductase [Clostridia bacterium]
MIRKTAIIIGGSSEIGKATAYNLAQSGYNLALTYNSNNLEDDKEFLEKLKSFGCEAKCYNLNLLEPNSVETFFEQIKKDFKCVDALVYVSGIAQKRQLIFDISNEEIDALFEVNVKSAIKCTREFVKLTINKNPASIVYVGSFVEKSGCSCESIYTATKSALSGLCKSLATELGNLDIRCNVVAPGFIDTKRNDNLSKADKLDIAEMTPLKRLGEVKDVANAIEFLVGEKASFITGQTVFVDGGLMLE